MKKSQIQISYQSVEEYRFDFDKGKFLILVGREEDILSFGMTLAEDRKTINFIPEEVKENLISIRSAMDRIESEKEEEFSDYVRVYSSNAMAAMVYDKDLNQILLDNNIFFGDKFAREYGLSIFEETQKEKNVLLIDRKILGSDDEGIQFVIDHEFTHAKKNHSINRANMIVQGVYTSSIIGQIDHLSSDKNTEHGDVQSHSIDLKTSIIRAGELFEQIKNFPSENDIDIMNLNQAVSLNDNSEYQELLVELNGVLGGHAGSLYSADSGEFYGQNSEVLDSYKVSLELFRSSQLMVNNSISKYNELESDSGTEQFHDAGIKFLTNKRRAQDSNVGNHPPAPMREFNLLVDKLSLEGSEKDEKISSDEFKELDENTDFMTVVNNIGDEDLIIYNNGHNSFTKEVTFANDKIGKDQSGGRSNE